MKLRTMLIVLAATAGTNMLAGGIDAAEQSAPTCMDVVTGTPAACPDEQSPAVDIQVYDYTGLEGAVISKLLHSISDILANTGMSARVSLCRGNGALPHCVTGASDTLVVRILEGYAKAMKNARLEPLGQSYSEAAGGTLASVYLGSVRQEAAAANVPWLMALGYASAHEIGHLLLGAQAHTSRGLMKPSWDRNDFLSMGQNHFHFTREQAQALANRYSARLAASGAR